MNLAATKIVNEGISVEEKCIDANLEVAKEVRKTILAQSGVKLEDVPLEREHIASEGSALDRKQSKSSSGVTEDGSQSDKFKEAARENEADEDEKRWEERLKRVAKGRNASVPVPDLLRDKPKRD